MGSIIAWTPTNWITVFLMAFGGFIILKAVLAVAKALHAKQAA